MLDLVTDTRSASQTVTTDNQWPSGTLVRYWPGCTLGTVKTFQGEKSGRFNPGTFRVNPVRIAETKWQTESVTFDTGEYIPGWGKRTWNGNFWSTVWVNIKGESLIVVPNHDIVSSYRDFALQRAYGSVSSPDFDSQLFLAEIAETVGMIMNPLKGLTKLMRNVKNAKRLRKRLSALTDLTADRYLQYIYGLMPLVNDIQTIYAAVQKQLNAAPLLRAGGFSKISDDVYVSGNAAESAKASYVPYRVTGRWERSYHAKVYYRMNWENDMLKLVDKWGFNPLSIPVTMYQTLPCSFVVDWFFALGQWLKALQPHPNCHVLGNCVSEKFECKYVLEPTELGKQIIRLTNSTVERPLYITGKLERVDSRLIREVNLPLPTSILVGPGLNNLSKVVSSAFLGWQRLPKLKT